MPTVCLRPTGRWCHRRPGLLLSSIVRLITQSVVLLHTVKPPGIHQTWSSRDLSLGLETSRVPFYKSWSRFWSWNLRVLILVLVLEPSSLGLGLGLGTSESWSWSWSLSWNPQVSVSVLVLGLATMKTRFSSLMKREIVRLPPLLLWNGYLATVVC